MITSGNSPLVCSDLMSCSFILRRSMCCSCSGLSDAPVGFLMAVVSSSFVAVYSLLAAILLAVWWCAVLWALRWCWWMNCKVEWEERKEKRRGKEEEEKEEEKKEEECGYFVAWNHFIFCLFIRPSVARLLFERLVCSVFRFCQLGMLLTAWNTYEIIVYILSKHWSKTKNTRYTSHNTIAYTLYLLLCSAIFIYLVLTVQDSL